MRAASWSLLLICAGAILPGTVALAAEQSPQGTPPVAGMLTLDDLDTVISSMKRGPWQLSEMLLNLGPDSAGRRPEQDIAEYLVTDSLLQRVDALRKQIRDTTPPDAKQISRESMQRVEEVLKPELCRFSVVVGYWRMRDGREQHHALIHTVASSLPEPDRLLADTQLAAADLGSDVLREQVAPAIARCSNVIGSFPPEFNQQVETILWRYDQLRLELVERRRNLQGNIGLETKWTARQKPCPPPISPSPGDSSPLRLIRGQSLPEFYPDEMRRLGITGVVKVELDVDTNGCVVATRVADSAGSDVLDQSAVTVAFELKFQPAVSNGHAVRSVGVTPIRFHLPEPNSAAPPQPQP